MLKFIGGAGAAGLIWLIFAATSGWATAFWIMLMLFVAALGTIAAVLDDL